MARIKTTADGRTASALSAYSFTEIAAVCPDFSAEAPGCSSTNIFGTSVKQIPLETDVSSAGRVHGALSSGAFSTVFTTSKEILHMLPEMYRISAELLPCVIHMASGCPSAEALSVFGDHSDAYACRQTGFAMLCSADAQEAADLAAAAHISAIKSRIPFLHFYDSDYTADEIRNISIFEKSDLCEMTDFSAAEQFRQRALTPEHPSAKGGCYTSDVHFQQREAANSYYENLPSVISETFDKINQKAGTDYRFFNYHGAPDATHIIIAMGSVCRTIEETVDYLNTHECTKLGLVKVHLFRPFCAEKLIDAIPDTAEQITVLDRTKESGALGEPLWLEVCTALKETQFHDVPITSGRYGLGGKETTPSNIKAAFWNASWKETYRQKFTIGINDDISGLSLKNYDPLYTEPSEMFSCKFFGTDSVNSAKSIISQTEAHDDINVCARFMPESCGSNTIPSADLRSGKAKIRSACKITLADTAVFSADALSAYVSDLPVKNGGRLIVTGCSEKNEPEDVLNSRQKKYLAQNSVKLYSVSKNESCVLSLNDLMSDISINESIKSVYVPESWAYADEIKPAFRSRKLCDTETEEFVNSVIIPHSENKGNDLSVSAFSQSADGTFPTGAAKSSVIFASPIIPEWSPEGCSHCAVCSIVCPHSAIRPFILSKQELDSSPETVKRKAVPCSTIPDSYFVIGISPYSCAGCGSCADACPDKRLSMRHAEEYVAQEAFSYLSALPEKPEVCEKHPADTIRGSQLRKPLLEASPNCRNRAETPYVKLLTQLYGDSMFIADTTENSSLWAACSAFTRNSSGRGPAWTEVLSESSAQFGEGIFMAQQLHRQRAIEKIKEIALSAKSDSLKAVCSRYLSTLDSTSENSSAADELIEALRKSKTASAEEALKLEEYLRKKSVWIFADTASFDTCSHSISKLLSTGMDINIIVFDTMRHSLSEYSEPVSSKLSEAVMRSEKVYTAQISIGADPAQCIKALTQAESFRGPSFVTASAPFDEATEASALIAEQKQYVEKGIFRLYRYNPSRAAEGRNPYVLDSKKPAKTDKKPAANKKACGRAEIPAAKRYEYLLDFAKLSD